MLDALGMIAQVLLVAAFVEGPIQTNSMRRRRLGKVRVLNDPWAEANSFTGQRWYDRLFPTFTAKVSQLSPGSTKNNGSARSGATTGQQKPPWQQERPETVLLNMIQELQELLTIGMSPHKAWTSLGVLTDHEGIPYFQALESKLESRTTGKRVHRSIQDSAHVLIVIARVSHSTGIGFGALLNAVQESLASSIMLDRHRKTAISGPKASSQILQGLPLLGIAAAFLIGVNPIAWFFSSGIGAVCALCGALLLVAGRKWSARLVGNATSSHGRSGQQN